MSLPAKKWVARGIIVILGIWPLLHFTITKSRGLDPWKLAGFAMYTAPRLSTHLRLFGVEQGIPYGLPAERVSKDTLEIASDYLIRRRTLNPDLPPDEVADALFKDFPEYSKFQIEVVRMELDQTDGILKTEMRNYVYPAEAASSEQARPPEMSAPPRAQVSAMGSPLSRSFTAC